MVWLMSKGQYFGGESMTMERQWKPKYFQNKSSFVGFPIDLFLQDNTIMFECLMKVGYF